MSVHDARGFGFGGGRGFVAILDVDDPSKAAFQGLGRDESGNIVGIFARQNFGDVEFMTYPELDLREDRAFFHLFQKGTPQAIPSNAENHTKNNPRRSFLL